MLTPSKIVNHLQEHLPLLTDRFHDQLPVTSGSVNSGIFTITLDAGHGLIAGDQINISKALIRNRIGSIFVNSDDTISYITDDEHDLTAYSSEGHPDTWPEGLGVTLLLPAGQTVVELIPDHSAIPSNNEFVGIEGSVQFPITGEEYLLEDRAYGVSGLKIIQSVTATTLVIDLSDVPSVPDGPVIMNFIITNTRVSIAADTARALDMYSSQQSDDAWLFVIMTDRDANNSRSNDDDLKSLPGSSLKLQNIIQNFSTLVILPTTDDLGGGETQAFAYVDLFSILIKCLYGWEKTGYTGDGQALYNTAFYPHSYEWQARQQIDYTNGYTNSKTVALRGLEFTQTVFDKGESSANIDY